MPTSTTNRPFYAAFTLVFVVHYLLAFLHTPAFLPRVGVHVVAYLGLLVALGTVFGGLALWDALS